jgi:hypothetical protein
METTEDIEKMARDRLEQLAALSGWQSTLEALDLIIKCDAWGQKAGGAVH